MSVPDSIHAVTNADAGQAGGLSLPDSWTIWETSDDLSPTEAARRAREAGATRVVACGGDGTVNAVARALVGTDVELAVVPQGTANVLATDFGVPADPEEAVALADGASPGRSWTIDVGEVERGDEPPQLFLMRVGIGVGATMVTDADPEMKEKWGRAAYFARFVRASRAQGRVGYRIVVDGEAHRAHGVTCLVCNSVNPGLRGVRLLEDADLDDGSLDVVVFRWLSVGVLFRLAARAGLSWATGRGLHIDRSHLVRRYTGARVEVTPDPPQDLACDGEAFECEVPLRARVVPGALRVLVPAAAPDAPAR